MSDHRGASTSAVTVQDFSLLASLLPAEVVLRQVWIADVCGIPHPEEAVAVARAVPKRQKEFAAGRACARAALRALCGHEVPVPAGPDRAPIWPAGVVGSITHDDVLCAAAVARRSQTAGLGIDVELLSRFSPDLEAMVCLPGELARWPACTEATMRHNMLAAIFTAKEALFKAQYPLTQAWLDFSDVQIELPQDLPSAFVATLLRSAGNFPAGQAFEGRYALSTTRAAAAVLLPPMDLVHA